MAPHFKSTTAVSECDFCCVQDPSAGGGKTLMTETAPSGNMLLTERAAPSEDLIIVPTSSVDITDVSRMHLDLRRQAQVEQRSKADPHAADKHFVELLVKLLQKVRSRLLVIACTCRLGHR